MDKMERYENPLITRYASEGMARLWSSHRRHRTWRLLWVALAKAERELGLPITEEQVRELADHTDDIDFQAVAAYERKLRHDVMAHVHAYGDVAPKARPIIHLGATSCYVTDNADLIMTREALDLVLGQLAGVIDALGAFATKWKSTPCLGYTHYQTAQLVTVGKRATLWCHELIMDLRELERRRADLKLLGVKGTTGTQASFLALFEGDQAKVEELERKVAAEFGFDEVYPVSGQTYSRKVDVQVLSALSGLADSLHKMGTDLRLLAHEREIDEPFESKQIGSSAMAYKRNPMRSERMCSLARFLSSLPQGIGQTAATQWLERTLDDSAIRRIAIPQAFLAADAILSLASDIVRGLVVNEGVIARHVADELPFMATEEVLMAGVRLGGDRQELHESIRVHSLEAAAKLKAEGGSNDLAARLEADPAFAGIDIASCLDPKRAYGRSPEQVDAFVAEHVEPIRRAYAGRMATGRAIDL